MCWVHVRLRPLKVKNGSHVAVSRVQSHLVHVAQCSSNIKSNMMTPTHMHKPSECFQLIQGCTCAAFSAAWHATCGDGQAHTQAQNSAESYAPSGMRRPPQAAPHHPQQVGEEAP